MKIENCPIHGRILLSSDIGIPTTATPLKPGGSAAFLLLITLRWTASVAVFQVISYGYGYGPKEEKFQAHWAISILWKILFFLLVCPGRSARRSTCSCLSMSYMIWKRVNMKR